MTQSANIAPPAVGYFPAPAPVAPPAPLAPSAPAAPTFGADQGSWSVPTAPQAYSAPTAPAAPLGYGAPQPYAAQPTGQPTAPQGYAPTAYTPTNVGAQNLGQGPIVQTGAAGMVALGAKVIPAGTSAAIGAARAIASNTNGSMVKAVEGIVTSAGEPLVKLSWALLANTFDFLGAVLTLRFGDAARAVGKIFTDGAVSIGSLGKKIAQPATLTAAAAGGKKLGLGQAIGAGLSGGLRALKSSFIWAIPASAINAFIDYKYRDQTDVKRLGTNFAADVVGYTATGMAGAAVGAMVGSMTVPIIGTLVGAAVGIGLGFMHDKITRPMLSDALHDAI